MQNKSTKISALDLCLITTFIVLEIISVTVWSHLNQNLPHWDMARHLFSVIEYKNLWLAFFKGERSIFGVIGFYNYYPPLVHNLALPFYFVFGKTKDAILYSNFVWILIFIFSIYFLSLQLFGRKSAVISVLFLLASPMLIGQMREFQLDMPLLAIFALSLYLLFKTDFFRQRLYSILFGLSLGAGMLTKWTFFFYVAPAVVIYLAYALSKNKKDLWQIIGNFFLALFVSVIVAGYWYLRNVTSIRTDFTANGVAVAKLEGDPVGFNLPAFTWYWKVLMSNFLLLPLSLIAVFGLLTGIIQKGTRKKTWFLFSLFVIYYLIFSILPNKDTRYILPALAVLAPIAGIGAIALKNFWTALLALLIIIFLINNLAVSFGRYFKMLKVVSIFSLPVISENGYTSSSPGVETCDINTIVESVPPNKSARLIGKDTIDFSNWDSAFYLANSGRIWAGEGADYLSADYLIARTDSNISSFIEEKQLQGFPILDKNFSCLDGSRVYIFRSEKVL